MAKAKDTADPPAVEPLPLSDAETAFVESVKTDVKTYAQVVREIYHEVVADVLQLVRERAKTRQAERHALGTDFSKILP